ncbi:hypothetical protein GIB67_036559 [Kingdonia uniflora]|uniref:Uncharacterized protein n=1 Tax=Kingdonia uniflora TaxID=39325 RepID=A0A7J7NZJ0_9MAGN|nr:hypothetical protein GIB67_036559 [Kingdonia uniflora]
MWPKFLQSTELLRAQIMEGKESYIDLENRFSQYKAENDANLDSLRDIVASLRSFERAAIPTVYVDKSRHIVASGRALVIPVYQESEEAEYEAIVDIIFEHGSPVFGQREVLPVVGFLTFLYSHKGLKMIPILGFAIPYFC